MAQAAQQDVTHHPLVDGFAPEWASAWGEDRYGPFVEIQVGEATQRLRWIPPGEFMMGSPNGEPGRRDEWEFEPRDCKVQRGFWLFDTPCTQALWEAVMGDNPSHFKSSNRPVEQVSWHDCQKFVECCNELVPGATFSLPTEMEWEYACRAGSSDATYGGPMEIRGENNAPILDDIAWYGGNCGVEFDLDEGVSTNDWPNKQYVFSRGGTRVVATKQPNVWGLYDTLGNVWEWCKDHWIPPGANYSVRSKAASAGRVIRGGACHRGARYARAACRRWSLPGGRDFILGFRCLVQEWELRGGM